MTKDWEKIEIDPSQHILIDFKKDKYYKLVELSQEEVKVLKDSKLSVINDAKG